MFLYNPCLEIPLAILYNTPETSPYNILNPPVLFSGTTHSSKNPNREGGLEDLLILKKIPRIFRFATLTLEISDKIG